MSWFGGLNQFSNITDQISTFTKEVLTETTEEVEDPAAELQVARKKIAELENAHKHMQTEWEKLKQYSDEVTERAETSEFQIATISQEYRKLLQERDDELRRLKMETERLREQHRGLVPSGGTVESPLKELAQVNLFHTVQSDMALSSVGVASSTDNNRGYESVDIGGHLDYHDDFSDVISSQGEINRLQDELTKLRLEKQCWQNAAQNKIDESREGSHSDRTLHKEKIEELQLSFQKELEQHQREVTALQSVHTEKLHSISQRHQTEVEQLQYQIESLQSKLAAGGSPMSNAATHEVPELKRKLGELELSNNSLKERLEQITCESTKLQETNRHLASELGKEQLTVSSLHAEIEQLREHTSQEKAAQVQHLKDERKDLSSRLGDMQSSITEHEENICRLQQEHAHSQGEVEQLNNQVETLSQKLKDKELEVASLKEWQLSQRTEDDERRSVSKDLEEALTLARHRQSELEADLRTKVEELNSVQQELDQSRLTETSSKKKCNELEAIQAQEKEALLTEIAQDIPTVQVEAEHDGSKMANHLVEVEECLQTTKKSLNEMCQELKHILSVKDSLEKTLTSKEQLLGNATSQLEQARQELRQCHYHMDQLKQTNTGLGQQLETMRLEMNSARATKTELELKMRQLEEARRESEHSLEVRSQESVKYNKQLAQLRAHLIEVEERYTQEAVRSDGRETGLKRQLADLQDKLMSTNSQGAVQDQHNRQQLEEMSVQLLALTEQRDDALLQMSNAQEQADMNAQSLHNLQTVLEQFQRDQSSELAQALKKSQLELVASIGECQRLKKECEELKHQLQGANREAEQTAFINQEQEKKIQQLAQQVESVQAHLKESQVKVESLSSETQDRVDKNLVKNLFLGYVLALGKKKVEVLHLIAKILEFSSEEMEQAVKGRGQRGGGWLSGFWKTTPPASPTDKDAGSLSQMFVNFLESESQPKSKTTPLSLSSLPTSHQTHMSGYIDPRTDPDRPSLATMGVPVNPRLINTPHEMPTKNLNNSPDQSSSSQVTPKLVASKPRVQEREHSSNSGADNSKNTVSIFSQTASSSSDHSKQLEPVSMAKTSTNSSFQSILLKNVLAE